MKTPKSRPNGDLSPRDIIHLEKLIEAKKRAIEISERLGKSSVSLEKLIIDLALAELNSLKGN